MQKLKAVTFFKYKDKMIESGEVVEVENNDAHYLIEHGYAQLIVPVTYPVRDLGDNKMMTPRKKKGYVTK